MNKVLIAGGGGFIGNHLVKYLKEMGTWVRAADLKKPEFSKSIADEFLIGDLRDPNFVSKCFDSGIDTVFQMAADMGGFLFIFSGQNDADIAHNSALINLNIAKQSVNSKIKKLFFSSSACAYSQDFQTSTDHHGLKESQAIPANPDSVYGWEKLFSEFMYDSFRRNYGLNIRIARFHNIFGINGTIDGGRQKAPADICRQAAMAKDGDSIFLVGDGEQTRSFLYIDECVEGIMRLMDSDYFKPVNIGSDEMVSINQLARMVIEISGKNLKIEYMDSFQGVRGRSSDNTLIYSHLGWKPTKKLYDGLIKTYNWINQTINK